MTSTKLQTEKNATLNIRTNIKLHSGCPKATFNFIHTYTIFVLYVYAINECLRSYKRCPRFL